MTLSIDKNSIEPEALRRMKEFAELHGFVSEETGQSMVLHSIAISIKRIADVMEWAQTAQIRGELK